MMTVSAPYHPRTGLGGATWPLAVFLGFSIASLTQFASAAPITQPAEASSTVGGEADSQISPEDEPDANLVPTDSDPSPTESAGAPSTGAEITTHSTVPRSEDLLQLEPATSGETARFSRPRPPLPCPPLLMWWSRRRTMFLSLSILQYRDISVISIQRFEGGLNNGWFASADIDPS